MSDFVPPPAAALWSQLGDGLAWAQVWLRPTPDGAELRHVADRDRATSELEPVALAGLRALAQFTAAGAFRPLKAAPNLRAGWRCGAGGAAELGDALDRLYPGALADWHAARQPEPPVTSFRDFVGRQTGMYRNARLLDDATAAQAIRAGCAAAFCLKRRLWTVTGLEPDPAPAKSVIPCLEPCAVMLEFARRAYRIQQGPAHTVTLHEDELATLHAALEIAVHHPPGDVREGNTAAPANPRRVQLLREKLAGLHPAGAAAPEAE
jgi:hypothetical protein